MSGENEPSPSGENTYLQNEIGRERRKRERERERERERMRACEKERKRTICVYTKIIFGLVHANS